MAVDGVGAVELPTPPVAAAYQSNAVPVAVRGAAVAPWQYVTGEVTVGAGVPAVIFTVINARGPSHEPVL